MGPVTSALPGGFRLSSARVSPCANLDHPLSPPLGMSCWPEHPFISLHTCSFAKSNSFNLKKMLQCGPSFNFLNHFCPKLVFCFAWILFTNLLSLYIHLKNVAELNLLKSEMGPSLGKCAGYAPCTVPRCHGPASPPAAGPAEMLGTHSPALDKAGGQHTGCSSHPDLCQRCKIRCRCYGLMLPGSDLPADTAALTVEDRCGKNSDHAAELGHLGATR